MLLDLRSLETPTPVLAKQTWLPAVLSAWQLTDPLPTLTVHGVPPPLVLYSPAPWLAGVVSSWVTPDPLPTLTVTWRGPPGWSVDSPPRRTAGDATIVDTWIPADPLPQPERPPFFVPLAPAWQPIGETPSWLSAVESAWVPPDPPPTLTVTWRGPPGWSVNDPPRRTAGDVTIQEMWIPPDPPPTLEVKWMGRPGWSVDQPQPYARKTIDLQAPWWAAIPPDPNPTLTVQWAGRPGWSVDNPPRWRAVPLPPPPDPDPLPTRLSALPPQPVAVTYVPFAEAWLGTVIAAWTPADPPPTLERNLNPSITAVRVDNPPGLITGTLGTISPWLPGDPQPTVPRYGVIPTPPAFVQPFAGAPWVSAVLSAWAIVDPIPAAPRGWMGRPGWSVDSPQPLRRGADAVPYPQPIDPLPTLPPRFAGKPGWSVDQPPRFRPWLPPAVDDVFPTQPRPGVPQAPTVSYVPFEQVWLSIVGVAWQPPDPVPTLLRTLSPQITAVRVDAPPITLTGQFGNISDWIFPDPLPITVRYGPVLPSIAIVVPVPLGPLGEVLPAPEQRFHALQSFFIGDDWLIYGALTDEAGEPFDPTTASSITWKLDDESGNFNYFTLTLGNGISVGPVPNSPVPGVIIWLPALMSTTLAPQTYRDQLRAIVSGITQTFWQGPIQALQQLV